MNRLTLKAILAATLIVSAAAEDLVVSSAVDTFMGSADQAAMVTNLGATTTGANLFKIANPGAIRFLRVNADNTVDALSAADMLTALGTSAYAPSNVAITGGSVLLSASASGGATLRVPHGTAPSSPTDGDFWTTTSSVFARVNGATVDLAAGLSNWTEAVSSATPNTTVPAVSLSATNAATNVDAVVIPKGTGALLAAVPNNAAGGGNKRGASATDWQRVRADASQVATGTGATIGGGGNNSTSAIYATVAGGFGNSATGNYATVAGGQTNAAPAAHTTIAGGEGNTASAAHSAVLGGQSNTASVGHAAVLGGQQNTANANYSVASGFRASTKSVYAAQAHAAGHFAAVGDAQVGRYLLRIITTDSTTTELSANGSAPSASTKVTLPNNQVYKFRGQAVAREPATGDVKSWNISGTIKRGANAAATAIVGSVTITADAADTGAAAWTLAVDADTTNGALRVQGTGENSKTIRWLAEIQTVENG